MVDACGRAAALMTRLNPLLLCALPLLTMSVSLSYKQAEGPYYAAQKVDPSYSYLLGSLAYAIGQPSSCCLHPGVTVQINGAVVLRWAHAVIGQEDLVTDVLRDPEVYARILGFEETVIYAIALALAGWIVYRSSGRLELGLLIQTAPWIEPLVFHWMNPIAPEAILYGLTTLAAALMLAYILHASRRSVLFAVALGLLAGAGLTTKITYLPMALLPLLLLDAWRPRMIFLATAGLCFGGIAIPHWVTMSNAIYFWMQLFQRSGLHGSKAAGGPRLQDLLGSVSEYIHGDPVYVWLMLAPLAFWGGITRMSRGRPDQFGRLSRCLALLLTGEILQLVLASRQFNLRYLSPAYVLLCANMTLILAFVTELYPRSRRVLALLCLVAIAVLAGLRVRSLNADMAYFRLGAADVRDVETATLRAHPDSTVVAYYGASTIPFAVHFGDSWVFRRFSTQLSQLYPNFLFWDAYARTFEDFESIVKPTDSCLTTLLVGAPFGVEPMGFRPPDGARVMEVGRSGQEALYLARVGSCERPPEDARSEAGTRP